MSDDLPADDLVLLCECARLRQRLLPGIYAAVRVLFDTPLHPGRRSGLGTQHLADIPTYLSSHAPDPEMSSGLRRWSSTTLRSFFGLLPGISIHLYVRRLDLGLLDSCCGGLLPNAASMFPPGNNLLGHPMHLFVLTDGKGKARKTWHRVAVSEDKSRHMRLLGSAVRGAGLSHKGNKSFPC